MKARIFLLIALVTLMFAGCKKGVKDKLQNVEAKSADFVKQEVINYVLSKRVKGDKDLNNAIDTVLSQVNWSSYRIVYNELGQKLTAIELNSFSESKLMMLLYTNKGKNGYGDLQLVTVKKPSSSGISEMDAIALLHQGKEHDFTGAISYFKITKQFFYENGYENGERKYIRALSDKNKTESGGATTEACYEVYLITYWSDGSTTYDYMYSYCDSGGGGDDCHQQRLLNFKTASAGNVLRCGPWSGSGGGDVPVIIEEQINIEQYETEYSIEDFSPPNYIRTKYENHASILREDPSRIIVAVTMLPTTAQPMFATYVDSYNRNVSRTLTLFNHVNNHTLLSPTSVLLNWSCAVIGKYNYSNGNPSWTRQWTHTRSSVQ